jgi:hypothetical protein
VRGHTIELEIYRGKGGQPRADRTHPDVVKEGICAWMYDAYEVGHRFRYPEDLGLLCPWLVDSLTGMMRAREWRDVSPEVSRDAVREGDGSGRGCDGVRPSPDPTALGIVVKITRTALPE